MDTDESPCREVIVSNPIRRLPFSGAVNFRDLGGYRTLDGYCVAWRRVYRSDCLSDLTDADLQLLGDLGLHTICDFRVESERRQKPNRLPQNHGIRVHSIPFVPRGAKDFWRALRSGTITGVEVRNCMVQHYRQFAVEHAREYREMFTLLLAEDSLPMLFHCTSGKDRTGFAAALLLTALGVPWMTILEDYILSHECARDLSFLLPNGIEDSVRSALFGAYPDYLSAAFEAIRQKWGDVDGYLTRAISLSAAERNHLRARLLVQLS
jgi:protein-tyrosine phosphatase